MAISATVMAIGLLSMVLGCWTCLVSRRMIIGMGVGFVYDGGWGGWM